MRLPWARRQLWLEQSSKKEQMIRQLHGSDFTGHAARANPEATCLKLHFIFLVHAIVAVVLLRLIRASVNGVQQGIRDDLQLFIARAFWAAFTSMRQCTRERDDDVVRRTGIVLGAIRIGTSQNISRILYQSILEAPSSPNKWPVSLACELDATQHPVKTLVRTTR